MENDIKELQVQIAPESLADLVDDLNSKGFNEQQVLVEVERIKQEILAEFKQRIANGDDFLSDLEYVPVRYLH